MSNCTGHCCQRLYLSDRMLTTVRSPGPGQWLESATINDMIIPTDEANVFRCKHYDEKANFCALGEERPAMCKCYPYGTACVAFGCTWAGSGEATKDL